MKFWMISLLLTASSSAFASSDAFVAFERFNFEISSATSSAAKLDSAVSYFEQLDRLGTGPSSTGGCLDSIFSGSKKGCFPALRLQAHGGTGGVD